MKRIKEACICQTLHFMLREDVGHDYAVKLVKEEIENISDDRITMFHNNKTPEATTQVSFGILFFISNVSSTIRS